MRRTMVWVRARFTFFSDDGYSIDTLGAAVAAGRQRAGCGNFTERQSHAVPQQKQSQRPGSRMFQPSWKISSSSDVFRSTQLLNFWLLEILPYDAGIQVLALSTEISLPLPIEVGLYALIRRNVSSFRADRGTRSSSTGRG